MCKHPVLLQDVRELGYKKSFLMKKGAAKLQVASKFGLGCTAALFLRPF
jgi:hypothetical protein